MMERGGRNVMKVEQAIRMILTLYVCFAGSAVLAYFLSLCKEEWKKKKRQRQKDSNHVIISKMAFNLQNRQPSWIRKKQTWDIGGIDKDGSQSYFISGG